MQSIDDKTTIYVKGAFFVGQGLPLLKRVKFVEQEEERLIA